MNWGGPDFVLIIIAVSTVGWVANNWIRARHGYALEDEWFGKTEKPDVGAAADLARENEQLRQRLQALEERAATLEAIVTDSGFETASQIAALEKAGAGRLETRAN